MSSELLVEANGLHIWTESFGHDLHAPILLIAGAGAQSIFWEDEFCQRLAENERLVIRFDNRDTGLSDSVDFESSPYTMNDMAEDALAILDSYDLPAAHMVGALSSTVQMEGASQGPRKRPSGRNGLMWGCAASE